MPTKKPLISILMSVYNSSLYLEEAINSVLSQTYDIWELIVVEDGSTDNSLKILQKYAQKYPNIILVKNPKNMGIVTSLNKAYQIAQGDFIAKFDSDDIMPSNRLFAQLKFLLENPNILAVGGLVHLISEDGSRSLGIKKFPHDPTEVYNGMFCFMTIQHGGMMVRTSMLPKGFIWHRDLGNSAQDVDLVFRLFQFGPISNLSDCVLYYRQRQNSNSLNDPKQTFDITFKCRLEAVKNYGYKPTIKGWVTTFSQFFVIKMLPKKLIYPLFLLLRADKRKSRHQKFAHSKFVWKKRLLFNEN